MQRWEYRQVSVFGSTWWDSAGRNGTLEELGRYEAVATTFFNAAPLMNAIGAEGWELVGTAGSQGMGGYTLFFRRAKP